MKHYAFFTAIILSVFTITLSSCDKANDLFGGGEEDKVDIQADKLTVTPYELVTLTAIDYEFDNQSYDGSLGDKNITLIRTSPATLAFMVPDAVGEQSARFSLNDTEYEIAINVNKAHQISNPESLIEQRYQDVENAFDTLQHLNQMYNLQIDEQNIQVIRNYLADFEEKYKNSTAEEKQQLAQFMAANPDLFDFSNFNFDWFSDSLNTSRDFVAWDRKLTSDMNYFVGLVIATGATVGLFNGALVSLNPFAIAITGGALLTEVYLLKSHVKTMLNRAYKPFEFDLENNLRSNVTFENDVEYYLGIDATYRTLYNGDKQSSDVIIQLVANINVVTGYWNNVLENIPGTSGSISQLDDKSGYNSSSYSRAVSPEYISIQNISNSQVIVKSFSNNGSVKVKFYSEAITDDINFSFNLVYTNPDFSTETKTINAVLTSEKPVKLLPTSIVNNGIYDKDGECYGGPFILYYLNFTFEDPDKMISSDLSNIDFYWSFENNGCLAIWSTETATEWFSSYPISINGNSISVPYACSLGDNNSDWHKVKVFFRNPETDKVVSNSVEFDIIRGQNYP